MARHVCVNARVSYISTANKGSNNSFELASCHEKIASRRFQLLLFVKARKPFHSYLLDIHSLYPTYRLH
jgi:hypothetical protein